MSSVSERCRYCRWLGGHHSDVCPDSNLVLRSTRMQRWETGYEHGRAGKTATNNHPTYLLGLCRGESALEEQENGHSPY